MVKKKNSIKKKKYKHLSEKERHQIEALLKVKKTVKEIREILKRDKSTIYREKKRGQVERIRGIYKKKEYSGTRGEVIYRKKKEKKKGNEKIRKDKKLIKYIREKIKKGYAPDVIIGEIKKKGIKFKVEIVTKTLYSVIDKGIIEGVERRELCRGERKKKREKRKKISYRKIMRKGIRERPKEVEGREEGGHWEIDTMKGRRGEGKENLLTIVERKTRCVIIRKIERGTKEEVEKEITKLEREYKNFRKMFKSITADNGSEFIDSERLEESRKKKGEKRTRMYYSDAYSSWQRGSNENMNGIIRRFIKKGEEIGEIGKERIQEIEDWINNYPRRKLGYKTAREKIEEEIKNKFK